MKPVKYVKEVVKEGKRIRWPKRDVLVPTLIVVLVIAVFAAIILSLEDLTAASLISQLRNAFGSAASSASSGDTPTII